MDERGSEQVHVCVRVSVRMSVYAVCEFTCVQEGMGMNGLSVHACRCMCMTCVWMSGVCMCRGVFGGGEASGCV